MSQTDTTTTAAAPIDLERELGRSDLTLADLRQLRRGIYVDPARYREADQRHQALTAEGGPANKLAILSWMLNRHAQLADLSTGKNPLLALLRTHSLLALGRTDEAAKALEITGDACAPHAQYAEAELLRLTGDTEKSLKLLEKLGKKHDGDPELHYQRGLALDAQGAYALARAAYERALELDADYAPALFRLAYMLDLRGEDDQAFALYQRCAAIQPTYVNCLLNLGVIYDDRGEYEAALRCFEQVLEACPNHERARLFRKDSLASLNMYFDEDQARRADKQNLILSIPVTDFELSVRSRNCLNKMNIRTLGDLVEKTEAELLSYKNFGETSLMEIKEILAKKALRLGMGREALLGRSRGLSVTEQLFQPEVEIPSNPDAIRPIAEFNPSVRVRTALKMLGITTLGELTTRTSRELMSCKNFGQTSLDEVRALLVKHGMSLADEPSPGFTA